MGCLRTEWVNDWEGLWETEEEGGENERDCGQHLALPTVGTPLRECGTLASAQGCAISRVLHPPRVSWSPWPPWELKEQCLMSPRLQARPRDT